MNFVGGVLSKDEAKQGIQQSSPLHVGVSRIQYFKIADPTDAPDPADPADPPYQVSEQGGSGPTFHTRRGPG